MLSERVLIAALLVFLAVSAANSALLMLINSEVKPPEVRVTVLTCEKCDTPAVDLSGVTVVSKRILNYPQGSDLISRLNITRLPAVVLSGLEFAPGYEERDGYLVSEAGTPPYFSVPENRMRGLVKAVVVDADCDVCINFTAVLRNLEASGVKFSEKKVVKNGEFPVLKYRIRKLPALLLSEDISLYPQFSRFARFLRKSGDYFVAEPSGPYVEVGTGKLRGAVDVIVLEDSACPECYNASIHLTILERFGFFINRTETLDVSSPEGKRLVRKYGIDAVPTVLVTGDTGVYETFMPVWNQVGTVESDGTMVFRKPEIFGTYVNLTTGEIVQGRTVTRT